MAKDTRKLSIVVSVRDDTKKRLGAISARIERFGKKVGRGIAKAFKVGLAAAGVALALFVDQVRRQFAEIDKAAKDAFRFGVAIEDIAGLQLAADLAGLSISEMTNTLRDLGRRVSEAANRGAGREFDAITEGLKLDPKELNAKPIIQQLDIVLKELGKIENINDRNRIAYDVMGRSGIQAMTLMGVPIQGTIRETELLGIALTPGLTDKVEDVNDELAKVKAAFKGIFVEVVRNTDLINFLKDVKQLLIDIRLGSKVLLIELELASLNVTMSVLDGINTINDAIQSGIVGALNAAIDAANVLNRALGRPEIQGSVQGSGSPILDAVRDVMNVRKEILEKRKQDFMGLRPAADRGETDIVDEFGEGPGGRTGRRQPSGPGITQGRLLTGAAQSSAERLAAAQKEADQKRAEEARGAAKQREESNRLLDSLLRSAVGNQNANLGTLLQ